MLNETMDTTQASVTTNSVTALAESLPFAVTTPLSSKCTLSLRMQRQLKLPEETTDQSTDQSDVTSMDEGGVQDANTPCRSKPSSTKRLRPSSSLKSPTMSDIGRDLSAIKSLLEAQTTMFAQHQATTKDELTKVNKRCDTIEESMEERFEREARKRDLVIRGIPLNQHTSISETREMVRKLADSLQVEMSNRDILFVHKVLLGQDQGMLVVRFRDEAVRREFMVAFFTNGNVSTKLLGFEVDSRIFVGDNLTRKNSAIRKMASELRVDGKISAHGVRDGLIYVVLVGEEQRRIVKSIEELADLIANKTELQRHRTANPFAKRPINPQNIKKNKNKKK